MSLKKLRDLLEWPVMFFLLVGIFTAGFDFSIRGFSPLVWFLLSFWFILIILCMEVSMIRSILEKKQE